MISGRACAKAILLGEHAVVYGHPALALPLPQLTACAELENAPTLCLEAPDLQLRWEPCEAPEPDEHPLVVSLRRALHALKLGWPRLRIRLQSAIPVACGLGSGTAISTALWRALVRWSDRQPALSETLAFVQGMDQHYHGRASGLDAAVIVRAQPLRFRRTEGFRPLRVGCPLTLVIAHSGQQAPTDQQVARVAAWREANPQTAEAVLAACGALSAPAEAALASGDLPALGALLTQAQTLLARMGVSTPQLERLCAAACEAGALGAKLSGAGGGGVMLALTDTGHQPAVAAALRQAGAPWLYSVEIPEETCHV
jgi:mevalonate kinase